jgi:hydrogenase maturation protease
MEVPRSMVLGIGNVLMTDEGVGVRAAELLAERVPEGVRVLAPGSIGPTTVAELSGVRQLLVLDCVDRGFAPGSIVRLDPGSIRDVPTSASAHEFGVRDLLVLAEQAGGAPRDVLVLGVQPARIEPGVGLSREVEAALPVLVEAALATVAEWTRGRTAPSGKAVRPAPR